MVGPSSSHTAELRDRTDDEKLLGARNCEVNIVCMALAAAEKVMEQIQSHPIIAGLLGMEPDDMRIPDSFSIAEKDV